MSNVSTKLAVGFMGLGAMRALPMALRLHDQGFSVMVYSRNKTKTQPFADRGIAVAASAQELAERCPFILSCVTDDAAVLDLYLGADGSAGALAGAAPGCVIVEMSTVLPETSRRLAAAAQLRQVHVLDAPVSGSVTHAGSGQLVIFVGGSAENYQRVEPILSVLGRAYHHMGPNGSGNIMKLLVNAILGTALQAVGEAITMGLAGGLQREALINALAETTVVSPSQKAKLENIKQNRYPPTFRLGLMTKDFSLITQFAAQHRIPLPATSAAATTFTAALRTGDPDADYSAIIPYLEHLAGLHGRNGE